MKVLEVMKRYARLYLYFLQFSFSKTMEFRIDFFFRIGMDGLYYFVNLFFYKVIFLHTPFLAGWNENQIQIFVATYLVIDAFVMTLFSNNMWWLPLLVNKGDLDYYLVRPVSPLFFLSLREFAVNSLVNLFMALGILTWAVASYPVEIPLLHIALYCFFLLNGVFLYYTIRILLLLPVFWTHSARGMDGVFWNLVVCFERPDRIFTDVPRLILTTVLPFSLMASFPARLILEGPTFGMIFHLVGVTLFFSLVLAIVWKSALKNYSSASS